MGPGCRRSGYTAPQTARALNRVTDTVRAHLKGALGKLGARTTAQAVAIAIARGLLDRGFDAPPDTVDQP